MLNMNKETDEPQLSICIATMNRATFIGETLDNIVFQLTKSVEVVIVDGSKDDLTEAIVEEYIKRGFPIRYEHLERNGGVDHDYAIAVDMAKGRYCWLMTDDDLLKSGAVKAVQGAIQEGYDLIVVNSEVRDSKMQCVLEKRMLRFECDRSYEKQDSERFFVEVAGYLSFIGGVVIKRSRWDEKEKSQYYGTSFIHVGVIFQNPPFERIKVIANPFISIRYNNAMWAAKGFEIWMFKWPNLIWSFDGYSFSAKLAVTQREPWRKLKTLLLHRALGAYSIIQYKEMLEPRVYSKWTRFLMRGIAEMPGVIANLIVTVYLTIFYRKSKLPFADLKSSRFNYRNYFLQECS